MLRAVEGLSPSWLTYAPSATDWSMLMIFDHLARTERAVRISCEAHLNQPAAQPSIIEKLKARFSSLSSGSQSVCEFHEQFSSYNQSNLHRSTS